MDYDFRVKLNNLQNKIVKQRARVAPVSHFCLIKMVSETLLNTSECRNLKKRLPNMRTNMQLNSQTNAGQMKSFI